jgi:hypothetical protein
MLVFSGERRMPSLITVPRIEVVHPVETAEEGGFAATGGADQGRDFFLRHDKVMFLSTWWVP